MVSQSIVEKSYLLLIEFLLRSKHRVAEYGSQHGLTGMQTTTLLLLETARPMSSFKKVFNCDPSNITGLVDGLEQKELVVRYEDPEDRRLKMVKLTDEGVHVRRQILNQASSSTDSLLSQLTPEEAETFLALLQKVTSR